MTTLFNSSSLQDASLVNFAIEQQVTVAAVGLQPGESITFEMVAFTSPGRGETCNPCDLPPILYAAEAAWQKLMCCGAQPVTLSAENPVVLLDSPQHMRLRARFNGHDFSAGPLTCTVEVFESSSTITSAEQRGCCPVIVPPVIVPPPPPPVTANVTGIPCPLSAPFTWQGSTYSSVAAFVSDVKAQVSGATYNAATCMFVAPAGSVFPNLVLAPIVVVPPATTYCPSLRLNSACGVGCSEEGFAFRNNSLADPAATVSVMACGSTTVGKIYPTDGITGSIRHEIPYYEAGVIIGYMANQSSCAPVATPVTYVQPNISVAAPEVTITLPAPNLLATSIGATGIVTNTLSNGTTVVSNEPFPNNC